MAKRRRTKSIRESLISNKKRLFGRQVYGFGTHPKPRDRKAGLKGWLNQWQGGKTVYRRWGEY